MSRRLLIAAGTLALVALGGWLWSRHGLSVWLDAAIAFCI
ncbi:hypothetical protein ABIE19_000283 [Brevundimonas faecalis]|uniref:Phosphatidate cytidylyltransferase n=1 Tax=Brevundimonas faecalis TaxID=947378 RepID=A0ABV2R726_9CAUL